MIHFQKKTHCIVAEVLVTRLNTLTRFTTRNTVLWSSNAVVARSTFHVISRRGIVVKVPPYCSDMVCISSPGVIDVVVPG